MKIMFYTTTMQKGGGERVIANLANYLSNDNEIVIFSALNVESEYELNDNIKLIKGKDKKKSGKINSLLEKISYKKVAELKKCIYQNNPDIIISFFPEPCFRILALKAFNRKIKKIPIISSERNDPKREYNNFILKAMANYLYGKADGMVCQTEEAKEFFNEKIREKTVIIPNPINPKFDIERYDGEREKRIVAVGRLTPQKNHKLLIDAFKKLNRDDYTLHIYGQGGLYNSLNEYIEKSGLKEQVFLEGKKDDIISEIYKSEIFVLPSNYEGMPNALMEAMTLGLTCISTDCHCGGPKYLVQHEKNGLLVEVNNVDELCENIQRLIDNKDFANSLGINAKQFVKQFMPEKVCMKWLEFINSINEMRK